MHIPQHLTSPIRTFCLFPYINKLKLDNRTADVEKNNGEDVTGTTAVQVTRTELRSKVFRETWWAMMMNDDRFGYSAPVDKKSITRATFVWDNVATELFLCLLLTLLHHRLLLIQLLVDTRDGLGQLKSVQAKSS